jgi:hypothetical protein
LHQAVLLLLGLVDLAVPVAVPASIILADIMAGTAVTELAIS